MTEKDLVVDLVVEEVWRIIFTNARVSLGFGSVGFLAAALPVN